MEDKIIEIIKQHTEDGVNVTENSELFGDLGLSSLDMLTLIFSIEEKIEAKISIMDFVGIKTVGDLIHKIERDCIK